MSFGLCHGLVWTLARLDGVFLWVSIFFQKKSRSAEFRTPNQLQRQVVELPVHQALFLVPRFVFFLGACWSADGSAIWFAVELWALTTIPDRALVPDRCWHDFGGVRRLGGVRVVPIAALSDYSSASDVRRLGGETTRVIVGPPAFDRRRPAAHWLRVIAGVLARTFRGHNFAGQEWWLQCSDTAIRTSV
jgi:hypothetical protein